MQLVNQILNLKLTGLLSHVVTIRSFLHAATYLCADACTFQIRNTTPPYTFLLRHNRDVGYISTMASHASHPGSESIGQQLSPTIPQGPQTEASSPHRSSKRQKVTRACDSCKNRKRRCTGELPCSSCWSVTSLEYFPRDTDILQLVSFRL